MASLARRGSMARQGTFRSSRREEAQGTAVIDIGSSWTRVGVVGDASVRYCSVTPRPLRDVMHRSRDEDELASRLFPFLTACSCVVPELLSTEKPAVILVSASQNPHFVELLLRWLHASCGRRAIVGNSQLAALSSFGASFGVVLDVGWFSTRVCGVVGGVVMQESLHVSPVGWSKVIEVCRHQIVEGNDCFKNGQMDTHFLDEGMLSDFVRAYGVVAPEYNHPTLSDMYELQLKAALVSAMPSRAIEVMFADSDEEVLTIPKLVARCLRETKSANIFLTGGPTLAPNFAFRLAKELKSAGFGEISISLKSSSSGAVLAPVLGGLATQVALS